MEIREVDAGNFRRSKGREAGDGGLFFLKAGSRELQRGHRVVDVVGRDVNGFGRWWLVRIRPHSRLGRWRDTVAVLLSQRLRVGGRGSTGRWHGRGAGSLLPVGGRGGCGEEVFRD